MNEKHLPKLAGAVFCNSATQGEGGKVDCRGVFTSFLAWAYPTAIRNWHAILTVHDLPPGTTSIAVAISRGRGKKTTIATADIQRGKPDLGTVVNLPLRFRFQAEGFYTVHFTVVGTRRSLNVPVKVTTKKWPRFSKKQLQFLRDNPAVPHSLRMILVCSDCSQPYTFEESVLPDADLPGGVLAFPDSGTFECPGCGHVLHVRDIQGQLRDSMLNAVSGAMKGGK